MKFLLKIGYSDMPEPTWEEEYNKHFTTPEEVEQYGKDIVAEFNRTLRPGEHGRRYIGYTIVDKTQAGDHIWEKQNAASIVRSNKVYDEYKCARCGVTGRRYGIGAVIVRDTKYQANKYINCGWKIK